MDVLLEKGFKPVQYSDGLYYHRDLKEYNDQINNYVVQNNITLEPGLSEADEEHEVYWAIEVKDDNSVAQILIVWNDEKNELRVDSFAHLSNQQFQDIVSLLH